MFQYELFEIRLCKRSLSYSGHMKNGVIAYFCCAKSEARANLQLLVVTHVTNESNAREMGDPRAGVCRGRNTCSTG